MDFVFLWPAQSSLPLSLAMRICGHGTLALTKREVNPDPPQQASSLRAAHLPYSSLFLFLIYLFPFFFFAPANSLYLPRQFGEGLFGVLCEPCPPGFGGPLISCDIQDLITVISEGLLRRGAGAALLPEAWSIFSPRMCSSPCPVHGLGPQLGCALWEREAALSLSPQWGI